MFMQVCPALHAGALGKHRRSSTSKGKGTENERDALNACLRIGTPSSLDGPCGNYSRRGSRLERRGPTSIGHRLRPRAGTANLMPAAVSRTHQEDPPDQGAGPGGAKDGEEATTRLVSRAVKRAQAGDRDALAFLYARYADNLHGYVRSIVHDHHEAEDVTQQVFAKLLQVIGKYEEREVPFFAWMLRVARNVAVDHLRKQLPVPVEEIRPTGSRLAQSLDREQLTDLKDALATLPSAQREVLILRHFAGLSPTEIAMRTGKTEGSIHGLHHRGRRALTAELASRGSAPATRGSARATARSGPLAAEPPV
jgi:RNA polymerase sigma-70 factor, ECF subfamily